MSPSTACAVSLLLRRLGIHWEPTTRQTMEPFNWMVVTRHFTVLYHPWQVASTTTIKKMETHRTNPAFLEVPILLGVSFRLS